MRGSFEQRIRKAEEVAAKLKLSQRICSSCRGPESSILSIILLGEGGVYVFGQNCKDCWEAGGGGLIGIDPETGEPDSPHYKMIFLVSERLPHFEDWLGEFGHIRFGGAIDNTLAINRMELPDWAEGLDLSVPRTKAQIEEARAATRRFPFWGGEIDEQFDGLVLDY